MDFTKRYGFDGSEPFHMEDIAPDERPEMKKAEGKQRLLDNRLEISTIQEALYAEGRQSLLIIFQAMDAAGKDGTIRHVFTGVNPQGVRVNSFKQPSTLELSHDYLWRVHSRAPRRGMVGIFNRSHYEDVLVSRVLDLPAQQGLMPRELADVWKKRYRQIRDFERHLYENGTTILKFYLHLSKEEQTARFLARAEDETKNWKFSEGDLRTSERWDAYMQAYEKAIDETAAPHAPWFVVPADRKWYARAVVSEIVLDALKGMAPEYPKAGEAALAEMAAFRREMQGD